MSEPTQTLCQYTHLENGIHKFVFVKSTREAVDQHITDLEKIYESGSKNQMRVLIDLRPDGWPPMSYTFAALRRSNIRYPYRPTSRYAFVYTSSMLVSLASTFFNVLNPSRGSAKFFSDREADKAIEWLVNLV